MGKSTTKNVKKAKSNKGKKSTTPATRKEVPMKTQGKVRIGKEKKKKGGEKVPVAESDTASVDTVMKEGEEAHEEQGGKSQLPCSVIKTRKLTSVTGPKPPINHGRELYGPDTKVRMKSSVKDSLIREDRTLYAAAPPEMKLGPADQVPLNLKLARYFGDQKPKSIIWSSLTYAAITFASAGEATEALSWTKVNDFSYATAEVPDVYGSFLFEFFGGTRSIKKYLVVRLEPGIDPACLKAALIDGLFVIGGTKIKTKRICAAGVELDLVLIKIQGRAFRSNPVPAEGVKGANPRKKSGLMVEGVEYDVKVEGKMCAVCGSHEHIGWKCGAYGEKGEKDGGVGDMGDSE